MVTQTKSSDLDWVLLSYRIPREPSTPRIAVWRKLKDLGVVQLGDGLVALPHNPRTRESLEWVAGRVLEADGDAMVWLGQPTRRIDREDLASRQRVARTEEYQDLVNTIAASGEADPQTSPRTITKWRRQWRKIDRRDYLQAAGRDEAKQAIADTVASQRQQAATFNETTAVKK